MYPGIFAKTQPDHMAVLRAATGEGLTYKQLDDRANQLAQLLFAQGLRRGGHVSVMMDNRLEFFEIYWACMRSGLYFTGINRYLSPEAAAYIVNDSGAHALIVSGALEQAEALGQLSPAATVKLAVGSPVAGFADYEPALAAQPATPLEQEHFGGMMLYSSGTTGKPKGILRPLPPGSPADGVFPPNERIQLMGFDTSSIYLSTAPLYHAAPLSYGTMTMQAGGTVVVMDKFDPEQALAYIEQYRITHSQWVPTMFIRLLKLPEDVRNRYDLSSLRMAIHAAAPCPIDVKRAMIEWWGPIITEYYSQSEGIGQTLIFSDEWLKHPGSVGRGQGSIFHICDEDGNELPPGTPGLIYGEMPATLMFNYHGDPAGTAAAAHPVHPTWRTVGDIGYLDEEGYLYLTDRKAFMIVSGGVNIYPQQIEDVLALHPQVGDVAVIGVPDRDMGEVVKAVVEPAPGVEPSDALAQEIMDFVREKLGRQLAPRSVDFVAELPRLPTGKLYKKALREQYWGDAGANVSLAARI